MELSQLFVIVTSILSAISSIYRGLPLFSRGYTPINSLLLSVEPVHQIYKNIQEEVNNAFKGYPYAKNNFELTVIISISLISLVTLAFIFYIVLDVKYNYKLVFIILVVIIFLLLQNKLLLFKNIIIPFSVLLIILWFSSFRWTMLISVLCEIFVLSSISAFPLELMRRGISKLNKNAIIESIFGLSWTFLISILLLLCYMYYRYSIFNLLSFIFDILVLLVFLSYVQHVSITLLWRYIAGHSEHSTVPVISIKSSSGLECNGKLYEFFNDNIVLLTKTNKFAQFSIISNNELNKCTQLLVNYPTLIEISSNPLDSGSRVSFLLFEYLFRALEALRTLFV